MRIRRKGKSKRVCFFWLGGGLQILNDRDSIVLEGDTVSDV